MSFRVLLKIMPLGCRANSGSLVTCTCQPDGNAPNTIHTKPSSPTPTVTRNITHILNNFSPVINELFSRQTHPHYPLPFSLHIYQCEFVSNISCPMSFIVFTWNSLNFSNGHCVRLKMYSAQRNHVLVCTFDVDDTMTIFHGDTDETLLIFAVLINQTRCPAFRIQDRLQCKQPMI